MASPVVVARFIATYWLVALLFKSLPFASAIHGLITSVTCKAGDDNTEDSIRPRQWTVDMTNIPATDVSPIDFLERRLSHYCWPTFSRSAYTQDQLMDIPDGKVPKVYRAHSTFATDRSCSDSNVDEAIRSAAGLYSPSVNLGSGGLVTPLCNSLFVPKLDFARIPVSELPDGGSGTDCAICNKPLSYYEHRWYHPAPPVIEAFNVKCPHAHLFHAECIQKWYAQHTGPEAEMCPACGNQMAINWDIAHTDWKPHTH